jgi:hypothetical protein
MASEKVECKIMLVPSWSCCLFALEQYYKATHLIDCHKKETHYLDRSKRVTIPFYERGYFFESYLLNQNKF